MIIISFSSCDIIKLAFVFACYRSTMHQYVNGSFDVNWWVAWWDWYIAHCIYYLKDIRPVLVVIHVLAS